VNLTGCHVRETSTDGAENHAAWPLLALAFVRQMQLDFFVRGSVFWLLFFAAEKK